MSSRDNIILELDNLMLKNNRGQMTLIELHNILRRNNIIESWRRKDYVLWLVALNRIKIEGEVVKLL